MFRRLPRRFTEAASAIKRSSGINTYTFVGEKATQQVEDVVARHPIVGQLCYYFNFILSSAFQ